MRTSRYYLKTKLSRGVDGSEPVEKKSWKALEAAELKIEEEGVVSEKYFLDMKRECAEQAKSRNLNKQHVLRLMRDTSITRCI